MSKRIGYARVSADDQNLDLQRDALTKMKPKSHPQWLKDWLHCAYIAQIRGSAASTFQSP